MFEAQLLKTSPSADVSVYSPWFPRQGDSLIATLDLIETESSAIVVRVFTKNTEDTGDGTDADSGTTINTSTVGQTSAKWSGVAKELVRYRFTVSRASSAWVLFRMLNPVWFDDVKA